jgi:hypothetical protein
MRVYTYDIRLTLTAFGAGLRALSGVSAYGTKLAI